MKQDDCDQDSDAPFMKDTDGEIDTVEIEEEDWMEYMKRRTAAAVVQMRIARIPHAGLKHTKE